MQSPDLDYSVSARGKLATQPIADFLAANFAGVPIKSVFGFTEYTPLYGGRKFSQPELSDADIAWLYDRGIGYRIPLQNLLSTRADYEQSRAFLDRHHRAGNSVIVVRDEMAGWVRSDYPLFEIEASVILQVRNTDRLEGLLKSYDVVVLHPELNDRPEELAAIPDKRRIRLFVNAGCMYQCPTMECYGSFSRMNKQIEGAVFRCAQLHDHAFVQSRAMVQAMTEFDVPALAALGFTRFKRLRSGGATGY